MWQRWRNFLENNQQILKNRYFELMLPTLAGAIMYFAKEQKSYAEKPELDFPERKNMGDVRIISIFRHNDFFDYVYIEEKVAKEAPVAVFLALFQFDFTSSHYPIELPITWHNYLAGWLEEQFSFNWLHQTIEELWTQQEDEPLIAYLNRASHGLAVPDSSNNGSMILKNLYLKEDDNGSIYLLVQAFHQSLLEHVSSFSVKELYEHHEWYFWRFRADIRKITSKNPTAMAPAFSEFKCSDNNASHDIEG